MNCCCQILKKPHHPSMRSFRAEAHSERWDAVVLPRLRISKGPVRVHLGSQNSQDPLPTGLDFLEARLTTDSAQHWPSWRTLCPPHWRSSPTQPANNSLVVTGARHIRPLQLAFDLLLPTQRWRPCGSRTNAWLRPRCKGHRHHRMSLPRSLTALSSLMMRPGDCRGDGHASIQL